MGVQDIDGWKVLFFSVDERGNRWNVLLFINIPLANDRHEAGVVLLAPLSTLGGEGDTPVILHLLGIVESALRVEEHKSVHAVLGNGLVSTRAPDGGALHDGSVQSKRKLLEVDIIITNG